MMDYFPAHVIIWLFVVWPVVAVGGIALYIIKFDKLGLLELSEDRKIKDYDQLQ